MTHAYHKETHKGLTIRIYQDDDCMNPFVECDGEPDIITFMNRYDYTTRKEDSGLDPESFLEKAKAGGYFVRPLHAYIHSGIAFSLSNESYPFNDRFDSGMAGFIFWTPEKRESVGLTDSHIDSILQENETRESWLETSLARAVEVLNDYANGNSWGFTIENAQGETLDSCGGFLGDYDSEGGALSEARSNAEYHAKQEIEKERATIAAAQNEALTLAAELEAIGAGFLTIKENTRNRIHELAESESKAKARLAALEGKEENENE